MYIVLYMYGCTVRVLPCGLYSACATLWAVQYVCYLVGCTVRVLPCGLYSTCATLWAVQCVCYLVGCTVRVLPCGVYCTCATLWAVQCVCYLVGCTVRVLPCIEPFSILKCTCTLYIVGKTVQVVSLVPRPSPRKRHDNCMTFDCMQPKVCRVKGRNVIIVRVAAKPGDKAATRRL